MPPVSSEHIAHHSPATMPRLYAEIEAKAAEIARLREVVSNFEFVGPDEDGDVWLQLNGNGTSASGGIRIGQANQIVTQVAQALEKDRRAALEAHHE